MKKLLKFIRPDSLFGQLLLMMLLSAAILQTVNFYSVYSIQTSYATEFLNIGHDYISSVYLALGEMSEEEQVQYLEKLLESRSALHKPFRFKLIGGAPAWETESYFKSTAARDAVSKILTAAGVDAPDVRARVIYRDSPEGNEPEYRDYVFPFLQVMAATGDGKWLELTHPLVLTDRRLIWRQRLFILLESIVFSVIVIILIRRATRPLYKLGLAAEAFGRNPEVVQPFEETGSIEVREAAQSFNKMRQRIHDNLNERNRMLEAMGHDLRTPLARIQLRLDKIQPDLLREKFAANIDEIQSIIEQGLELARSLCSSEKTSLLDVAAFVESIIDDMQAQGENVFLEEIPEEDVSPMIVMARPVSLKRGVDNLLINAVKYAGGAHVSVTRGGGDIVIDVDDNGPGIPQDMLEKVFEPYYRLEYSRNRGFGGTGLGLAIARNMIILNNGSLVLSNKAAGGLRARIRIPRINAANLRKGNPS